MKFVKSYSPPSICFQFAEAEFRVTICNLKCGTMGNIEETIEKTKCNGEIEKRDGG